MAQFDLNNSTTTNFANTVPDFIVDAKTLDYTNDQGETFGYFSCAPTYFGYLFAIPEVWSAASALATYTTGQGWNTTDNVMKAQLNHITGTGKETFSKIIWNHLVTKWIVGDSFIEVKKGKTGTILNMINISPERVRLVYGENGLLKRYDVWNNAKWKPIELDNMIHSQNKKIGDQVHGTSMLEPLTFAIDARNEALADERTIKHRDKALGIVYYTTNNKGKAEYANTQIEKGVKNGEMIGLLEGTAEIQPYPSKSSEDRQAWIQYLEGFIYQNFGVQRGMITSDGSSEVGGKMGNVNFTPIHGKERGEIQEDLETQQGITVSFDKPAELGGLQQETQAKNTGQTNIQPNDVEASITRE